MSARLGLGLLVLLVAACGEDSAPAGADAGSWTGDDLAGACALDKKIGEFVVETGLGNYVQGGVKDAVTPSTVLEQIKKDGPCVLLKRNPPFCNPACDNTTEVCGLDLKCHPAPRSQDVGSVTVTGLTKAVIMQPDAQNGYFDTDFVASPFTDGALVRLAAQGGSLVPAFALRGLGVEPLEIAQSEWLLVPGQAFEVKWTPSGRPDLRVDLRLNVDQHGNTPLALECEVPDTGSFTIPASMLMDLLAAGQSGVPNANIERHTVDSVTAGPGCVELIVRSPIREPQLKLRVQGVDYCPPPQYKCPVGKTCNKTTELCE
jgi:hypothetical protein